MVDTPTRFHAVFLALTVRSGEVAQRGKGEAQEGETCGVGRYGHPDAERDAAAAEMHLGGV